MKIFFQLEILFIYQYRILFPNQKVYKLKDLTRNNNIQIVTNKFGNLFIYSFRICLFSPYFTEVINRKHVLKHTQVNTKTVFYRTVKKHFETLAIYQNSSCKMFFRVNIISVDTFTRALSDLVPWNGKKSRDYSESKMLVTIL